MTRRNHLREQGRYVKARIQGNPAEHGLEQRPGRDNAFVFEYQGVRIAVGFNPAWNEWSAFGLGDAAALRFGECGRFRPGVTVAELVASLKATIEEAAAKEAA